MSANDSLSQVTNAASRVTQGSVLGPIQFVIYANNVDDKPRSNYLLYAVGVEVISPRKQAAYLQSSLADCFKWS